MFLLIALVLLLPANPSASANLVQEFRQRDQALLDAIAPGNAKVWDEALAPDAVYVDENGTIMNRADFMKQVTPLPAGASGTLSIISYSAQQSGDVVSVIHTDDEQELYYGQKLHAQYLMTETWQQQNGNWKLLLVHAISVLQEPKAITLPASDLDAYVGNYAAAPDLKYTIRRDRDHLVGERPGRPSADLKAEVRDVFFIGSQLRTRKIFERDASGKVADFVDRREGSDLVWKKVS
jgi:hypothetical protein